MRQSRTRKKIPRGALPPPSTALQQQQQQQHQHSNMSHGYADAGASSGSSFDNGCVDCHDYYEIHV